MLKMQVIGHLGKDAEAKEYNGKSVINFNIAHTEKFNGQTKTTWIEAAYWTERTGIAPYLKKGIQVYVEGQPEVKTYQKKDGTNGVSLALRVGQVQLLSSGPQNQNTGGGRYGTDNLPPVTAPARQQATYSDMTEPIEDLPF
jgi:single-strand DNA-binding protein